jgi:hypothetical protein
MKGRGEHTPESNGLVPLLLRLREPLFSQPRQLLEEQRLLLIEKRNMVVEYRPFYEFLFDVQSRWGKEGAGGTHAHCKLIIRK